MSAKDNGGVNPLSFECVKQLCGKMSQKQITELLKHIFEITPDSQKRACQNVFPDWRFYQLLPIICELCHVKTWKLSDTYSCEICKTILCRSCYCYLNTPSRKYITQVCINLQCMSDVITKQQLCQHRVCDDNCMECIKEYSHVFSDDECDDGCVMICGHKNDMVKCTQCSIMMCECMTYFVYNDENGKERYKCISCFKGIS